MSIVGNHTAGFHTLASSKRLKASGFSETKAEAIVEVVDEALGSAIGNLATKADLKALEGKLEGRIGSLEGRIGLYICMLGFAMFAAMVALQYLSPIPAGT